MKSPPTPVDGTGDLLGAARRRALEQQVFEEVADAAQLGRLVARTDADPDAGGHRQRARDALGGHRQSGVQLGDPQITHESVSDDGAGRHDRGRGRCHRRGRHDRRCHRRPRRRDRGHRGRWPTRRRTPRRTTPWPRRLSSPARRPLRTSGCSSPAGDVGLGPRRGRGEADLALLVDLLDRHLDLLAEREHVLDGVDPLAAAQLGDVHQAVTAREDVDEGAELGDVDDAAVVGGADVGLRRVDDRQDPAPGPPPSSPGPRHRW